MDRRLNEIANIVGKARCVADIGCDHGYLGRLLLARGMVDRYIATDISANSLRKAYELLCGTSKADFRCGDGLKVLVEEDEVDVIVISGMGGYNIIDIIDGYNGKAAFVLGAQKDVDMVRRKLYDMGYIIKLDYVVKDNNKFYDLIRAERGEGVISEMQIEFGIFYNHPTDACIERLGKQLKLIDSLPFDHQRDERRQRILEVLSCRQ